MSIFTFTAGLELSLGEIHLTLRWIGFISDAQFFGRFIATTSTRVFLGLWLGVLEECLIEIKIAVVLEIMSGDYCDMYKIKQLLLIKGCIDKIHQLSLRTIQICK